MIEIWKDIENLNGYQISNTGKVRNHLNNDYIMKPFANIYGYLEIVFSYKGKKIHKTIHSLVAKAFIDNPNSYTEVNHKDENKQNNNVYNLEWCTRKYNNNYGTHNKRSGLNRRKFVVKITNNYKTIFTDYNTASEHEYTSIDVIRMRVHKGYNNNTPTGEREIWRLANNQEALLVIKEPIVTIKLDGTDKPSD